MRMSTGTQQAPQAVQHDLQRGANNILSNLEKDFFNASQPPQPIATQPTRMGPQAPQQVPQTFVAAIFCVSLICRNVCLVFGFHCLLSFLPLSNLKCAPLLLAFTQT